MSPRELTKPKLAELLSQDVRVLIPLHVGPDGDSIGAALATASACRQLGSEPLVVSADAVPTAYHFLSGWSEICSPEEVVGTFDILLLLDCSSLSRIGGTRDLVERVPECERPLVIVIDHHSAGESIGDYLWSDPQAAATCEMIFDWMHQQGIEVTPEVAEALYTGITTDTGFFAFPNTKAGTFRRAARLAEQGARPPYVYQRVNEERSVAEVRIMGRGLQKLQVAADGKVAWTEICRRDLAEMGADSGDTEGVVNHLRSIAGTELAVIFVEMDTGQVKVSFRSRHQLDVAKLAREFGGGGHARAAGAKVNGSMTQVREQVIRAGVRLLGLRAAGGDIV